MFNLFLLGGTPAQVGSFHRLKNFAETCQTPNRHVVIGV